MRCHHSNGNICVVCDIDTNTCCFDDIKCEECKTTMCRSCYDEKKGQCLVCTYEIVTNKQLIPFLLKKTGWTYDQAVTSYKRMKKREKNKERKSTKNKQELTTSE